MTQSFSTEPARDGAAVTLTDVGPLRRTRLPFERWSGGDEPTRAAVRYLKRLVTEGTAQPRADGLFLDAETIIALPPGIAATLHLPPIAPLSLSLSVQGRIESPDGVIRSLWQDRNQRRATPTVTGPFVTIAGASARLSPPVYRLLRAIDGYNASAGGPGEARIAPWLAVQDALEAATGEKIAVDGTLQNLRIYQAGAFALDVRESPAGPQVTPILMSHAMRRSLADETDAPETATGGQPSEASSSALPDNEGDALLVPELQRRFAEEFARQSGTTGPAVVLGRNVFVVIEPELQAGLDVVKAAQTAPVAERRSFIANPRAYLDRELGEAAADAASLFVETHQYSSRVLGLGRWEKPSLDWLKKQPTTWLPESFVLTVGGHRLEVTPTDVEALKRKVDDATANFAEQLSFKDRNLNTLDVIEVLESLNGLRDPAGPAFKEPDDVENVEAPLPEDEAVLLIDDHIEAATAIGSAAPRMAPLFGDFPFQLLRSNKPKRHQVEGFDWLVAAWLSGTPGVLLADDMGLGKTFQALSFLAWFQANQVAAGHKGRQFEGPMIIVAPTALLNNWVAEAAAHLTEDALGERVDAFGSALSKLKMAKRAGWTPEDALDVDRLRTAGWILTTYETLATYHRAFARIPYSVGVFDEMQKVKSPDTMNTHALKALNVDFVLGMTGTPIENRLEDLWCIMDRVVPGYLGGLRDFSKAYSPESAEALLALKSKVDQPQGRMPPVMLRRMKQGVLDGLPIKTAEVYPETMPPEQALAYEAAVAAAQGGERTMGAMLKTIHALRGISLHPAGAANFDAYDPVARKRWVAQSARVRKTLQILAEVQRKGEKALVFIEDRSMQIAFAAVVGAELHLPEEPPIINGESPGDKRQRIVNDFQHLPRGFAVLILSPKAAGIGLTITAANHVIHLSRWWNPAVEDQCNDRVYRIGQTLPVTVHVPLAVHPGLGDGSFDNKLDALLDRKRALSRDMLSPPISEGDVAELFQGAVERPRNC